jgi:hypothetical protein
MVLVNCREMDVGRGRKNEENKGTLETAQKIAAHDEPRTTKLCDRSDDQLTLGMTSEGSTGLLLRSREIK